MKPNFKAAMGQSKIVMKRALRGLYAGRHIQFGNKISEDGGNKTRRSWKPNRQKRRLFSIGLDRHVWLDVTTHALRCMDRVGGLDEYMLKLPLRDLHSEKLLYLRKRIAGSYEKKTMVPPDLEKKIRAVMEWSLEQKNRKAEQPSEEEEEGEGKESFQDLSAKPVEDDYISQMFAKFSIKQEQASEDGNMGVGGFPFGRGRAPTPSSERPQPSPEEFPETLFSNM